MLCFLIGVAALVGGNAVGALFYGGLAVLSSWLMARLWRGERALRKAEEAQLPEELRPVRRVPRKPIRFPLVESVLTFIVWYAVAVAVDRVVSGGFNDFTFIAIAPFAAFILATITIAGRHMAFRLTAEEEDEQT